MYRHEGIRGIGEDLDRTPVLLADLTSVIEPTLIVSLCTMLFFVARRAVSLAALAHALSVVFFVFVGGHYVEKDVIGIEGIEALIRRRSKSQFHGWCRALSLCFASSSSLGEVAVGYVLQ